MLNNDCCLLYDIYLNSERISFLLQSRFKRNSNRTSFIFKSCLPEQLLNNIKLPCSLLKTYPKIIKLLKNDEENILSESSDDEIEQISSPNLSINITNDDYLDKLAQWEPNKSSTPPIESDEEEEEEKMEDNIHIDSVYSPTEISSSEVEDLFITFVQYPIKTEPIININIPQLDGQNDFLQTKRLTMNQNKKKKISKQQITEFEIEKSLWKHMSLNEQKYIPTYSKSTNKSIKKRKQSLSSKRKNLLPIVSNGKTILDYFQVIQQSSIKSSNNRIKPRSENYFNGCIVIDDDAQEIEVQRYTYLPNIHTREKFLNHTPCLSSMRIKWLLNVELILLEYISIYHEKTIQTKNNFLSSKFISIIILNFLKIFLIRNNNFEQDEFIFYQFSLTLYLRYLLIELSTYEHKTFNEKNNCLECQEYFFILNHLFDLLFDFIEYDICQNYTKKKYRSLLIEDDYFNQLKLIKRNPFNRIKLIIYFIELIQIHRNKCLNKKEEFFLTINNRIYQWIENFIQQIIYNTSNHENLSVCFNVIELCLLFIHDKVNYIKQISMFLAKLCLENFDYIHLFLFDKNLLPDIRLLVINELIWKKFNIKFQSIDYLEEFFQQIENSLKLPNSIDDMKLLLVRSLFNTYADLIIDLKNSMLIYSTLFEEIFRTRLESISLILINLSNDANFSQQIKRTVILFRLLKCKWNRL